MAPGKEQKRGTRLVYENVDELSNRIIYNDKLDKTKDIIDELQENYVTHCEHNMRFGHNLNQTGMRQFLDEGES